VAGTVTTKRKILLVVNRGSGQPDPAIEEAIADFIKQNPAHSIGQLILKDKTDCALIRRHIRQSQPDVVAAVGGDGTVKLVAEMLVGTAVPLGIVPAGSANGMAKELLVPSRPDEALRLLLEGTPQRIHLTRVNDELCIHLSDIGFNASVVRAFDAFPQRGMWGYVKAAWKVLWRHSKMKTVFSINNRTVESEAVMVVIANATSYGTGVRINPEGRLDDDLFEVVIVKKISLTEILKMRLGGLPFDPAKTELYQTRSLLIRSSRKVHFQVDGEYCGKVNEVRATLLPDALYVIVPGTPS